MELDEIKAAVYLYRAGVYDKFIEELLERGRFGPYSIVPIVTAATMVGAEYYSRYGRLPALSIGISNDVSHGFVVNKHTYTVKAIDEKIYPEKIEYEITKIY